MDTSNNISVMIKATILIKVLRVAREKDKTHHHCTPWLYLLFDSKYDPWYAMCMVDRHYRAHSVPTQSAGAGIETMTPLQHEP